jgi:beta-barrel assembly-enhancing protease
MNKLMLALLLSGAMSHAQEKTKLPQITDADEIRASQVLSDQFVRREGMQLTPQTAKIDHYLQAVGDRVAAHAQRRLPYSFHFDPSPSFKSAVGLPGGVIFVGGGILAYMDSEDQLAAVLGHEIEHIALNQCHDRLVKVLSDQHLSAKNLKDLKLGDFLPGYGSDNEFAADRGGIRLAIEAGYSASGAIRLLQTFMILAEQMPNAIEAKSRIEERIKRIQSLPEYTEPPPAERPLALPPAP